MLCNPFLTIKKPFPGIADYFAIIYVYPRHLSKGVTVVWRIELNPFRQ
jgi:hypothetical protein